MPVADGSVRSLANWMRMAPDARSRPISGAYMDSNETLFAGVVMGWEPNPARNGYQSLDPSVQIVSLFCPGKLESGRIQPTARMMELAAAGFQPIAIVYCNPGKSDCYSLLAHHSVSEAVHQHLVREADAIFRVASDR